MNAIKDSIKSGRTVVGTTGAPNVDVSILADAGYDFLLFDTQHSPWEIKQLQPSIQAMRGKQAAPLLRVAGNHADQICFALDAGARGIVVPMVNTRAEAEAAEERGHPHHHRAQSFVAEVEVVVREAAALAGEDPVIWRILRYKKLVCASAAFFG